MKCIAVPLDDRAILHVIEELKSSNFLGRMLVSSRNLSRGVVLAVAPMENAGSFYDFHSAIFTYENSSSTPIQGGRLEVVRSTEIIISKWISDIIYSDSEGAVLSESFMLRAEDLARPSRLPKRTFSYGDFVYHCAIQGDSADEIAEVVSTAYPVPLSFACIGKVDYQSLLELPEPSVVHQNLVRMCNTTDLIILGAYDGESVLVWTNAESNRRSLLKIMNETTFE